MHCICSFCVFVSASKHEAFTHCWNSVFDAFPTLKQHWVNASCLLRYWLCKCVRTGRSRMDGCQRHSTATCVRRIANISEPHWLWKKQIDKWIADKLFISTRHGGVLNISNFITCLYKTFRAIIRLWYTKIGHHHQNLEYP